MQNKHDLAVAWRIYPKVSKTPIIHPGNKLRLVETSLRSFLECVKGLSVSYYFILDGCPPTYEQLIENLFGSETHQVMHTASVGNHRTFAMQVEWLLNQTESENVYFAEDDYLYRPGLFKGMINLLQKHPDVDFVSPYCHMDTFTHPIHQHQRSTRFAENQYWFTDSSTCLTFLTTKSTLRTTAPVLFTYCNDNLDCSVWLLLTKTFVRNPFAYIRLRGYKESGKILRKAYRHGWKYLFSTPRYMLWIPYPAIATHLEAGLESPGVDWIALSRSIDEEN